MGSDLAASDFDPPGLTLCDPARRTYLPNKGGRHGTDVLDGFEDVSADSDLSLGVALINLGTGELGTIPIHGRARCIAGVDAIWAAGPCWAAGNRRQRAFMAMGSWTRSDLHLRRAAR